MTGNQTVRTVD